MTDIQICNLALARLGDSRITALTDASAQAQYCSLFYAQTLEELQSEFDWQFCRRQVSLTAGTAPLTGYSNKYALPVDFIRALRLEDIDASENFGSWEIIGTNLHTNMASPVVLDYIGQINPHSEASGPVPLSGAPIPAIFIEALSLKLAAVLAMPLTGSKELFKQCAELYMATVQKPAFGNATEAYAPARTTAAPVSVSEICRRAILRVGSADLFKPHGEPMVIAQSLYESVRDSLLSDFQWSFARAQVSIVKEADPPKTGYSFRYAIPAASKQIIRVNNIDDSENNAQWEVVGGFIHTNFVTPIILDYTATVTDVAKFPPIFVEILTASLAFKLASIVEFPTSQPSK
jgi:hypothetical protein